ALWNEASSTDRVALPPLDLPPQIDRTAAHRFDRRAARLVRHRFGTAAQVALPHMRLGVRFAPHAALLVRLVHRLPAQRVSIAVDPAVAHHMTAVCGGGASAGAER